MKQTDALARRILDGVMQAQYAWQERPFVAAAANVERAQAEHLRFFLTKNATSAYGRAHGFGELDTVRAFQDRVPIVTWTELEPWIARAAAGEASVLTCEPVRFFERTSGSTSGGKLVPYTASYLAELHRGIAPWFRALARSRNALAGTQQYWSLSPAARKASRTDGGVPIGTDDDTAYVTAFARWATRKVMAVPGEIARAPDIATWRRWTLEHLVKARALGLISIWSPSFLTLLMEALELGLDDYLRVLDAREREEIDARLQRDGRLTGEAIWPRLQVVSCWMDAGAARQLPALQRFFPRTFFQPKGLLATEGMVTFPLPETEGGVLAVASHFYEFVDLAAPEAARPKLAHELAVGGEYAPILTTGGGLVRYRLMDRVRCVGHWRSAPLLRFLGRIDRVSDLCGEKLSAADVEHALEMATARTRLAPAFAMLVPKPGESPRYQLFLETDAAEEALAKFQTAMEEVLSNNPMYRYARVLGQLAPVELQPVRRGWERYVGRLVASGMREGDIKPVALELREGWSEVFADA